MLCKKIRKLIELLIKNKVKDVRYQREGTVLALVMEGERIIDAKVLYTKKDKRPFSNCLIRYFDIITSEEFYEEIPNERGLKIARITINPEAIRMVNKNYPGTIKDENKNYFSLNEIIEIEKKFLLLHLKKWLIVSWKEGHNNDFKKITDISK